MRKLVILLVAVFLVACGSSAATTLIAPDNGSRVERLQVVSEQKGSINAVVFAPDGETFASAGDGRTIYLWNASNQQAVRSGSTNGRSGLLLLQRLPRSLL